MKKLFALALVLLSGAGAANSQEAFKHLSIGLEAATTGIGLELALPIVTDHLVLAAGYNYGNASFNVKGNSTLNVAELSGRINQYIDNANNFLAVIIWTNVADGLDLDTVHVCESFKSTVTSAAKSDKTYPDGLDGLCGHSESGLLTGLAGRSVKNYCTLDNLVGNCGFNLGVVRAGNDGHPEHKKEE